MNLAGGLETLLYKQQQQILKLRICNHCSNLWIQHINIYLLSPQALMITSALLFQLLQQECLLRSDVNCDAGTAA